MALSADEVKHVAMLARLALDDEDISSFADELSKILDYAQQVGEVAAEDVPPTVHPYPLTNVFRDDTPGETLDREELLAGAPEAIEQRFAVPQIVAEEG